METLHYDYALSLYLSYISFLHPSICLSTTTEMAKDCKLQLVQRDTFFFTSFVIFAIFTALPHFYQSWLRDWHLSHRLETDDYGSFWDQAEGSNSCGPFLKKNLHILISCGKVGIGAILITIRVSSSSSCYTCILESITSSH